MLAPSLRRKILTIMLGVGLLTTPILQVSLGAAISAEAPAGLCDQVPESGDCCDCCDSCDDFLPAGDCPALCFTAYALPAATSDIATSQIRLASGLHPGRRVQRLAGPEPDPPKQTLFL